MVGLVMTELAYYEERIYKEKSARELILNLLLPRLLFQR
jgi:hypothetical protein